MWYRSDSAGRREFIKLIGAGSVLASQLPITATAQPVSIRAAHSGSHSKITKLIADSGAPHELFGNAVALVDGIALVGVPFENNGNGDSAGAVSIYEFDGSWMQAGRLTASDGGDHDGFGFTVAFDGETALVAAPRAENDDGEAAGAVYVFEFDGSWTETAKLTASDGDALDLYGDALALDGDTALVGASRDDNGNGDDAGAAYVYELNGSWTETAKLTASNGGKINRFGFSAALDGDRALVGAIKDDEGSVHAFEYDGSWSEDEELTADDGKHRDFFGFSIDLDGDTALIGAARDDNDNGENAGATYVFEHNGSWHESAKLTPADGAAGDGFGSAITLQGDTALIGAYADPRLGGSQPGAAYFYDYDGTWNTSETLTADDGEPGDRFGWAVAFDGQAALIGANTDDNTNGNNAGAAYGFSPKRIRVAIDVKPGSDINPINPEGKGNIPVGVLTTDEFDPVDRVDIDSLRFGDPEDVRNSGGAAPAHGGHIDDLDNDGDADLLLHFPTVDTGFDGDENTARLEGKTTDGTPLFGEDALKIVKRNGQGGGKP